MRTEPIPAFEFDRAAWRRRVAAFHERWPLPLDAEDLERLGQASFADELLGGGYRCRP